MNRNLLVFHIPSGRTGFVPIVSGKGSAGKRIRSGHQAYQFLTSYNQRNRRYKACLKILFQKRCKIIVITSNCDNPLVKYSNYHIIIPHKEKDEKIATFYSQLGFNYILSIIYSLIYKRNKH